jgi:hypothetical protein
MGDGMEQRTADVIQDVVDAVVTEARVRAASASSPATRALATSGVLETWAGKRSPNAKRVRAAGGVNIMDTSRADHLWPFAGEFGVIAGARRRRRGGTYEGYNAGNLPAWKGNQHVVLDNGETDLVPGYALLPTVIEGREEYSEMLLVGLTRLCEEIGFKD